MQNHTEKPRIDAVSAHEIELIVSRFLKTEKYGKTTV